MGKYLVICLLAVNSFGAIFVSKSCSESEKERLIEDTQLARKDMKKIIKDLRAYKKEHELDKSIKKKVNAAIRVMKCSITRSYWTRLKCVDQHPDAIAYTFAFIGKTLYMTPSYWSFGDSARRGIVIHELTHKCIVGDAAYFWNSKPQDVGGRRWSGIADTYRYWQTYGTCIPEIDC